MLPYALVLCVLTILSSVGRSQQDISSDISQLVLYGENTTIFEFPYFAALEVCGAAILSDKWLVTAAHCVTHHSQNPGYKVWVGGSSKSKSKETTFKRVIIHPQFRYIHRIPVHDIALLELNEKLTFSDRIQPVKIASRDDGRNLLFVGKGRDETGHQSKYIKKIKLIRLTTEECLQEIPPLISYGIRPYLDQLEKANICARRAEDKPGACEGDSGSPLTHNHQLVGLASYIGNSDCRKARLNFFTNVATYRVWIKSVTGLQ